MIYVSEFRFPNAEREYDFLLGIKRKCYNTFYPFQTFGQREIGTLSFEPITILYGGNGSGKTTALNVMAETLNLRRDAPYNRTNFFGDYTALCRYKLRAPLSEESRVITSDDVFDFMLSLRALNDGIHQKREELFEEYLDAKYASFRLRSLEDYEQLRKSNAAKNRTQSRYVRENLMENVREHSNGESAFLYFVDKIKDDGLYLLDEPENSLSPAKQQELTKFLEDGARFFNCQFVIATHSPFLLSLRGARVYDLDDAPVRVRRWTELPNVRAYYDFFQQHQDDFE